MMSTPQIPNLLTFRGRGGGRRGRGANSNSEQISPEATAKQQDTIIQATDNDANISRISAVQTGYLEDKFASALAPVTVPPGGFRRLPIINRGTYARTLAIDRLVKGFLSGEEASPKQIISLGAGSDTRFFRLKDAGLLEECVYHELDFPENTKKKVAMIHQSSKMRSLLGAEDDVAFLSDEAHAPRYHLHAIDLRQLDPNDVKYSAEPRLREIRADTATLIISECCLTYLRSDTADAVITYITTNVLVESTPKGLLLYEPINPFDAFGKVMVSNLASRGIVLQTLQQYGSLEAQISRLKKYGFGSGQGAMDLAYLQENWINEVEKERISRLEMLDEIEELDMLMKHYCITWAWSDGVNAPIWSQWRTIQSQP